MLNGLIRLPMTRAVTPLAKSLLHAGVSPDVVTVTGAVGASLGAALLIPTGHLFVASLVLGVLALTDLVDGTMARLANRASSWGAFLDSNLDRLTDAAIFGSIGIYYSTRDYLLAALAIIGLAAGFLVSYARARAESLGFQCVGGIMERAERLIVVLVAIGLDGLGVPYAAAIGLWLLAIGSSATFVQRLMQVHAQGKN